MTIEHLLEKRAKKLSLALTRRKEILREAIAPSGERPPFSSQLSKQDALTWWRKHRYDDLGTQVLKRMQPGAILELDKALTEQTDGELSPGVE